MEVFSLWRSGSRECPRRPRGMQPVTSTFSSELGTGVVFASRTCGPTVLVLQDPMPPRPIQHKPAALAETRPLLIARSPHHRQSSTTVVRGPIDKISSNGLSTPSSRPCLLVQAAASHRIMTDPRLLPRSTTLAAPSRPVEVRGAVCFCC